MRYPNDYARQLAALKRYRRKLAAMSPAARRREALKRLIAAGICTPTGRLSKRYR